MLRKQPELKVVMVPIDELKPYENNAKKHTNEQMDAVGGHIQPGYQLRYIRFLDPAWEKRLTVPVIPYEEIDEIGAGMYKGEHVSVASRRTGVR